MVSALDPNLQHITQQCQQQNLSLIPLPKITSDIFDFHTCLCEDFKGFFVVVVLFANVRTAWFQHCFMESMHNKVKLKKNTIKR